VASQDGATALIKASLHGHKDTVELLVTYGADVEAECLDGKVALDFCVADACARVLQSAERTQRWHRRRILAIWAN